MRISIHIDITILFIILSALKTCIAFSVPRGGGYLYTDVQLEWVDIFSFQIYNMVVHANHDLIDTVS